ncbi:MAG: FAD-dependent thymidylate synthase [Thermomicrobiales bacterium]
MPERPMRTVYALTGIPPEVQAYAMAKYSRSRLSMRRTVAELSAQRAEEFLESFYFQYGHRSIADLAHVAMAVENVSILAAIAVVDQQVWDGQERSTRYQDFARTGYYTPDAIAASPEAPAYTAVADALFTEYAALSKELTALLVETVGKPETMDEGDYTRTLRARAFDVTRALLPLATITSVGQITSARTLERQISELLSSPLAEIRAVAEDLRAACQTAAFDPAVSAAAQLREALDGVHLPAEARDALAALATTLDRTAAAPTLVKYTAPLAYQIATAREMRQAASELLTDIPRDPISPTVALAPAADPTDELVATLLYQYDPDQHSYRQILEIVRELSAGFKQAIADLAMRHRGSHDDLLRAHQVGVPLQFDCTIDIGAFRDLHRHRRCVQIIPAFSAAHGTDDATQWFAWGLGDTTAARAADAGLVARYQDALDGAQTTIDALASAHPDEAIYLLPMANRCRALFKMDYAEAAYIIEQRTKVGGHFSYRHAAYAMYTALAAREPSFARHIRVVPPTEVDLLRR